MSSQKRRYHLRSQQVKEQKVKKGAKGVLVLDSQPSPAEPSTFEEPTPVFNSLEPTIKIQFGENLKHPSTPNSTKKISLKQNQNAKKTTKSAKKLQEEETIEDEHEIIVSTEPKPTNNLTWTGTKLFIDGNDTYYDGVFKDGVSYKLNDCVLLDNSKDTFPSIGQILILWEDSKGEKWMQCKWFYKPESTSVGKKPYHGNLELFDSAARDETPINLTSIKYPIKVESFDEYKKRTEFPENVYYYRDTYDPTNESISTGICTQWECSKRLQLLRMHQMSFSHQTNSQSTQSEKKTNKSPIKRGIILDETDVTVIAKDTESSESVDIMDTPIESSTQSRKRLKKNINQEVENSGSSSNKQAKENNTSGEVISSGDDQKTLKESPTIQTSSHSQTNKSTKPKKRLLIESESEEDKLLDTSYKNIKSPDEVKDLDQNSFEDDSPEETFPEHTPDSMRRSPRINKAQQRKLDHKKQLFEALKSKAKEESKKHAVEPTQEIKSTASSKEAVDLVDSDDDFKTQQSNLTSNSTGVKKSLMFQSTPRQSKLTELLSQPASKFDPRLKQHLNKNDQQSESQISSKKRIFASNYLSDESPDEEGTRNFKRLKKKSDIETVDFSKLLDQNMQVNGTEDHPITLDSEATLVSASRKRIEDDIEMSEEDVERDKQEQRRLQKFHQSKDQSSQFLPQLIIADKNGTVITDTTKAIKKQKKGDSNNSFEKFGRQASRSKKKILSLDDDENEMSYKSSSEEDNLDGFIADDNEEVEVQNESDEEDEDEEEEEPKPKKKAVRSYSPEPQLQDFSGAKAFNMKQSFEIYLQFILISLMEDINPETFDKHYFNPAIRKVEEAVFTKKEFLLRSSVWEESFKKELESRPIYRSWPSKRLGNDCEVCQRTNHPVAFEVSLEGPMYDSRKIWKGEELPPFENEKFREDARVYQLGRFCHERTEMFHQLHHYKYHLFQRCERKLESFPSGAASDEVMTSLLSNSSWLSELYTEFKQLLENAENFGTEGLTIT